MRNRVSLLALASVAVSSAASAEPAHYFNKPAVERAAFEADLGRCVELAQGVTVQPQVAYSANPYAAAVGGFFAGIMASRERRALTNNIMRTCMADKGYRRLIASKTLMKELGALKDEDRTTRLHELATEPSSQDEALPR